MVMSEGDQLLNSIDRHRGEVLVDFLDGRAKVEVSNDPIRFNSSPFYSWTTTAPTWDGLNFGAFEPPSQFLTLDHLHGPFYIVADQTPYDSVDFMGAKHEITARRDAMNEVSRLRNNVEECMIAGNRLLDANSYSRRHEIGKECYLRELPQFFVPLCRLPFPRRARSDS